MFSWIVSPSEESWVFKPVVIVTVKQLHLCISSNSISHASANQMLQAVNLCSVPQGRVLMRAICVVKAAEGNLKETVVPHSVVWVGELQPTATQREPCKIRHTETRKRQL